MTIPLFDTTTPLAPLRATIRRAIGEVLDARRASSSVPRSRRSSRSSPPTSACGTRSASPTAPTRSRSRCARSASAPGDEVVVPSFTFYATAEAIPPTGARPVFCDVDPETLQRHAPRRCAPRSRRARRRSSPSTCSATRAAAARSRRSACRCSRTPRRPPGARLGRPPRRRARPTSRRSRSTRPRTSALRRRRRDRDRRRRGRRARARAALPRLARQADTSSYVGYNSRLDELQAAILRVAAAAARRAGATAAARRPRPTRTPGLGEHVRCPAVPDGAEPAWHLYVVTPPARRRRSIAALRERGIQARGYYRTPLHRQPAMAPYAGGRRRCPVTDELGARPPRAPDEPGAVAPRRPARSSPRSPRSPHLHVEGLDRPHQLAPRARDAAR